MLPVRTVKAAAPTAPVKHAGETPAPLPPKFLEYTPLSDVEPWQVMQFEGLAVLFQLQARPDWSTTMKEFHAFLELDTQRWFYVRRLFGICPLVPRPDAQLDDLRVHSREEICTATGLKLSQLTEELEHLRLGWSKQLAVSAPPPEDDMRRRAVASPAELRHERQSGQAQSSHVKPVSSKVEEESRKSEPVLKISFQKNS